MDLPQVPIPHRTADQGAGRVARRTEVAVPEQNLQLKTLLREARRWVLWLEKRSNSRLPFFQINLRFWHFIVSGTNYNWSRSNVQQYQRRTIHRAYSTQSRPRQVRYGEYNGPLEPFRKGILIVKLSKTRFFAEKRQKLTYLCIVEGCREREHLNWAAP